MNQNDQKKSTRPSLDDYFMSVANTISERATCNRGRSGCVIAKDNQLLVAGYVGSPKGLPAMTSAMSFTRFCTRTAR